jgi:FkbM family methyltransferase
MVETLELADGLAAANAALDAGDTARARAHMAELFAAYPDAPRVLWTAGRFLGLLGAHAEAAVQFKLAVQRDPALSHVEFAVNGKVVRLRDIPGSTWAAEVLDEFARGMYGLTDLPFARGDVAVDVGAHIGGVSVILATLHPEIRIVAYEPSSSNFAMLCENLRENGITNVTPVRQAVMGERGTLTLTWNAKATAGSTVGLSDAARRAREAGGWSSEVVECVTLDDVFAAHGIDRCSWLKLDCESAEWGIAAKTGVLDRVDRMALELHLPASRQAEGVDRCVQDFAALVNRAPRAPQTVVSSMVWMVDV